LLILGLLTYRIRKVNPFGAEFCNNASVHAQALHVRNGSGNRVQSTTARRMISGLVLKYLNGSHFAMPAG